MKKTYLNIFLTSLGLTLGFSLFNTAKAEPVVNRIQGNTPIEISCNVAKETYGKEGTDCAILSSSSGFADTLSAVPLAYKYHAPILMTSKDSIDSSTAKTLKDLKVKNVYIVGGTGVLSNKIEDSIKSMGIAFKRLGGQDRYETGMKIVKEMNTNSDSPIVIVSGENFPDALSVSPVAAKNGYPILLSRQDGTNKELEDYLSLKHPSKAYIVGGTGVVSTKTENKISTYTSSIKRISGEDRYETSANVVKEFGVDKHIAIATGEDFPDALLGSVYCAEKNAKLLLTDNRLTSPNYSFVGQYKDTLEHLTFLGKETNVVNVLGEWIFGEKLAGETSTGGICGKRIIKFVDENDNAFKPVDLHGTALKISLDSLQMTHTIEEEPSRTQLLAINMDSNEPQLIEKSTSYFAILDGLRKVDTYNASYELIPGQIIPAIDLTKDNILQECTLKYKKVLDRNDKPTVELNIFNDKTPDKETVKFRIGDIINIHNIYEDTETAGYTAGVDFSDSSFFKIISKKLDYGQIIDSSDYRYYPNYTPCGQSSYKLKAVKAGAFTVTSWAKNYEGRETKVVKTITITP